MKLEGTYSHHRGVDFWQARDLYEWVTDIFEAPRLKIGEVATTDIRDYIRSELEGAGWAFNVKIDAGCDLTVFARKSDIAFQLQTGNISRYAYDVLKLQHLYVKREIESAVLAVPTKEAATKIGSNIAYVERIWNELGIFDRVITVPIMVVAFE